MIYIDLRGVKIPFTTLYGKLYELRSRKAEFYKRSLWPRVTSHVCGRDLCFSIVRNQKKS